MKRTEVAVTVKKRKLTLSNLEKIMYPETGFTKGQVIDYYRRIAPVILPHLTDHPLTLKRYPDGVEGMFFYEKRCPEHKPDWMPVKVVPGRAEPVNYCVVNDEPSLIWVANLASIELHTMLYKTADTNCPSFMVFDLDPGEPATILDCIEVAFDLRNLLKSEGLKSFAKVSGGKGIHFYVPLNTRVTFDETKQFAKTAAQTLERASGGRVVSKMSKALRVGKIFIDWSQNDEHKTTVCAYSLRARTRPTVSMPVTWEELERAHKNKDAESLVFESEKAIERAADKGDLFKEVLTLKQKLP